MFIDTLLFPFSALVYTFLSFPPLLLMLERQGAGMFDMFA